MPDYRAEMGVPPMPDEGAPGPMTRAQRLSKMVIGKASDLTPAERREFSRMPMEPVPGQEVGVRKEQRKSEVYEKKLAKGGYTKAADGIAKRGKTKGTIVMCKGGYKK